jgi:preprotein translocase subunit Sss1
MGARTVAVVFGAIYLLIGIVGFVLDNPLFGFFEVNWLLNIVHILVGASLLYGSMSYSTAIQATRGVGAVLVILGVLGFIAPDGFGLVPLGGNDIWLHLATGAILLATGFMATDEAGATV